MTDLEATRLCAQASEVWKIAHLWYPTMTLDSTFSGVAIRGDHVYLIPNNPMRQDPQIYDPLHDDGQAMALVKFFKLQIGYSDGWGCLKLDDHAELKSGAYHYKTPNEAIVYCVAAMQQAKAKP